MNKNLKSILQNCSYNIDRLKNKFKINIELAGSLSKENNINESKDIDILITVQSEKFNSKQKIEKSKLLECMVDDLIKNNLITHTLSLGGSKFLGICQLNKRSPYRHLDIRLVNQESYVYAKMYYVSGRDFNKIIRVLQKKDIN